MTDAKQEDREAERGVSAAGQGSYLSIAKIAIAEFEEKRSRFIGHAAPVQTEQEALAFLAQIKEAHPTARHNAYAYVLRDSQRVRYSDDGEPQKTAGLPILEFIQSQGLYDLIVVVTRYFGGTLLGTGGLVRAYTRAAQEALDTAEILEYQLCQDMQLELPYALYDKICHLCQQQDIKIINTEYAQDVCLDLRMRAGGQEEFFAQLREVFHGDEPWALFEPHYCLF